MARTPRTARSIADRSWTARAIAVVSIAFPALVAALSTTPAGAQPAGKIPRVAFLSSTPSAISVGFREGLKEFGRVEDRNIVVEWRWTEGKTDRTAQLAAELVRLKPDLIVTTSGQPTAAVKAETSTIPIVFVSAGNPVETGLVASLARPGGNLTGLASLAAEGFTGKMIELLQVVVPKASRIAVMLNPTSADHKIIAAELPSLAERMRLTLLPIEVRAAAEYEAAFETATRFRADALVVQGDPLVFVQRARIAELAAKHRLPAMYFFRENVEAGGLIAYGPSLHDLGRRAASYVDKILNGAKPGELPVEQPTKFDLSINMKAAKALGITFSRSVLERADEVVQ